MSATPPIASSPPADLPSDPSISYVPSRSWTQTEEGGIPGTEAIDNVQATTGEFPETLSAGTHGVDDAAPMDFAFQRLIGVGGFGEVWEAVQLSLSRPVAVKRIRQDLLEAAENDSQAIRRMELGFRQEAMITACLEHPNIVPIHELGLDENGHPLLAMKLVRGSPWDKLIAEDFALPVPQFLTRHLPILQAVSLAVAFAHSRGIIHRDIKPTQIMVGEFGEVQLMDWGLAIRVEDVRRAQQYEREGKRPSQIASLVGAVNPSGTVAFMAPEQTFPTISGIGPLTDVYLLGGTLYFLLTGRLPHGATETKAAFFQAAAGEVTPPEERTPEREIAKELSRLAMKAMAKEPAERIPSAEAFHQALTDYLSGVSRRRESIALAKQTADELELGYDDYSHLDEYHKNLDRALILWADNNRIHRLRQIVLARYAEAALRNGDLTLARIQGERLEHGAKRLELLHEVTRLELENKRAAETLRNALSNAKALINFMLLDMHGGLKSIGRLDLLEKVALKSINHFAEFPDRDTEGDARTRTQGLRNIADVFKAKGRLEAGIEALHEASQIARANLERNPGDQDWQEDLSDTRDQMAALLFEKGDLHTAYQANQEGLILREALMNTNPRLIDWRSRVCWSYHQQGVIQWRQGKQQEALQDLEYTIRLREELCAEFPDDLEQRSALAYSYNSLTWILRAQGDVEKALVAIQRCLGLRYAISEKHPENIPILGDIAWGLKSMALLHEDRLEFREGLEAFESAIALCRRLSDSDPSNVTRRMELAFAFGGKARNLSALDDLFGAERAYREALRLQGISLSQDDTNGRDLRDYIYNLTELCGVLERQNRIDESMELIEEAVQKARRLQQRIVQNPVFAELHARTLLQAGRLHAKRGDIEHARERWEQAANLMAPYFKQGEHPAVQQETYVKALLLLERKSEAKPFVEKLIKKRWKGAEFIQLAISAGFKVKY